MGRLSEKISEAMAEKQRPPLAREAIMDFVREHFVKTLPTDAPMVSLVAQKDYSLCFKIEPDHFLTVQAEEFGKSSMCTGLTTKGLATDIIRRIEDELAEWVSKHHGK